MLIRIDNPQSDKWRAWNTLEQDAFRSSNSLSIFDRTAPPTGGYLIVGMPFNQGTEIVRPVTFDDNQVKTTGSILLDNGLRQNHLQGTQLFWTQYSHIILEGSSDGGKNWHQVGEYEIEYDKPQTHIPNSQYEQYRYYLKNPQTQAKTGTLPAHTEGIYSLTGEEFVTTMELLRECSMLVYGSPNGFQDYTVPLNMINNTLFDIFRHIQLIDKNYAYSSVNYRLIPYKANYRLPDLFNLVTEVRVNGCTIGRTSMERTPQNCATCIPMQKETDDCSCPEDKTACPAPCSGCIIRQRYKWSVTEKDVILHPVPEQDGILSIGYSGMPQPLTKDSVGIRLPMGCRELLITGYLFRHYFFTKKDAETQAYANNLLAMYNKGLEDLEDLIRERANARREETPKIVRGRRASPYTRKTLWTPSSLVRQSFCSNCNQQGCNGGCLN
jgi:hypothetical protein